MDPRNECFRSGGLDLGNQQESVDEEDDGIRMMDANEDAGARAPSTGIPESDSGLNPRAIPAPDSPSLSVQLTSPQGSVERRRDPGSFSGKPCESSRVPKVNRTQYNEMKWDQLRVDCPQRGFRKEESKAVCRRVR